MSIKYFLSRLSSAGSEWLRFSDLAWWALLLCLLVGVFGVGFSAVESIELWRVSALRLGLLLLYLAGAVAVVKPVLTRKLRLNISGNVAIWLVVLILLLLISAISSADPARAIWGNPYRADGLVTLLILIGGSLSFALVFSSSWRSKLVNLGAFMHGLFVLPVLALLLIQQVRFVGDGVLWSEFSLHELVFGYLGNTNLAAGVMVVTLPLAMYWMQQRVRGLWWLVGLVASSSAILYTTSVGAILSLGVYGLFMLGGVLPRKIWIGVLVASCMFGVLVVAESMREQSISVEGRPRLFRTLGQAVLEKPLLGWGWAQVDQAFETIAAHENRTSDVYFDKAHSKLLEYLVVGGVMAGVLLVVLQLSVVREFWRSFVSQETANPFWRAALLTLGIYIVHSQTNVISIYEELFFWLLVGGALIRPLDSTLEKEGRRQVCKDRIQ